jgi:hypothetical protein
MNRTRITRAIAAAFLGTALVASAVPAFSQSGVEGGRGSGQRASQMTEADRAQMRERMQARMNERLERMAKRLDIKPSQEGAWNEYRQARTAMFGQGARPQRPPRDADAATILRFRAEMAQRQSQRLLTMAEATAKLQDVLDPEQRKSLADMTRRGGKRGHHFGGRHRADGEHGGEHAQRSHTHAGGQA